MWDKRQSSWDSAHGHKGTDVSRVNPSDFLSGHIAGNNYLQSANFVTGVDGWAIWGNGDVEFNNGYFRGDISAATGIFGGAIEIGTSPNWFKVDSDGNAWSGRSTLAEAKTATFAATKEGVLYAKSAVIGSWNVNSTSIYTGTEDHSGYTTNAGDITIYSNGSDASIHAKNFYVDTSGNLTATSATITGTITATGGAIGGWTINSTSIYTGTEDHSGYTANAGDMTLYSNGTDASIHAKNWYIDTTGVFYTIGATIDGTSTIGGRVGSTLASAIDSSGHFIDANFNTSTLNILASFTFGVSGALQIGTYVNGVSGDIKISPSGILGRNSSNATTFSIDGTTGAAVFSGTVTALAGAIGGWTINATSITDTAGVVGMSSAVTAGDDIRFWAGNVTPASAPFYVTEAGALVASSATITGAITASSGSVGSFTIGTYLYTGTKTAYNDTNAGVHLGSDGIGIGNNIFTVSSAGALVATSATITGSITATTGAVGGWTIDATSLSATAGGNTTILSSGATAFSAGPTGTPTCTITLAGVLNATGATISGSLTATTGAIGGWTIDATSLSATAGGNTTILSSGATSFLSGPTGVPTVTITQGGVLSVTGGTITGATVQTATTGRRIVMNSTDITLYDSNGGVTGLLNNLVSGDSVFEATILSTGAGGAFRAVLEKDVNGIEVVRQVSNASLGNRALLITDALNITDGGTYQQSAATVTIAQYEPNIAPVPSKTGTGTLTMVVSGQNQTSASLNYKIEIDGVGSPNTFKWSDDGGSTWDATTVNITGIAQALNNGVYVTFNSTTGGVSGDYWTFATGAETFNGNANVLYLGRTATHGTSSIAYIYNANTTTGVDIAGTNWSISTPGAITATNINKLTITTPANGSTLTIADGQTLTVTTGGTLASGAYAATYSHPTGDGNLHVPANSTTNNGKVLTASASAGVYTWETPTVYETAGAVASHAALTTGIHGLAITAGQTLTVTTGGTLGSNAYTSTAYQASNATLDAVAGGTYTGDDSITTLGTIATGVWSATDIAVAAGGTGLSTIADGSILATNAADTLSAITWHDAGTKILTNTSGIISWETSSTPVYKTGQASRATGATGTFTIAHGLGKTPTLIQIIALHSASYAQSFGTATSTSDETCTYNRPGNEVGVQNATHIVFISNGASDQSMTVDTLDATNITLNHDVSANDGNVLLQWMAWA